MIILRNPHPFLDDGITLPHVVGWCYQPYDLFLSVHIRAAFDHVFHQ